MMMYADNRYDEQHTTILATPQKNEFMIRLKSNPTTGYVWVLKEYNTQLVQEIQHYVEAPSTDLIGAPGHEVWLFRVLPLAFANPELPMALHFVYARPWENDDVPTEVVFNIRVKHAEE